MTLSLDINQRDLAERVGSLSDRELIDFLFEVCKQRHGEAAHHDAFTESVIAWWMDGKIPEAGKERST